MIVYLDTHVAVWLGEGRVRRIGPKARKLLETAQPLLSPMVLLELEFLYQVNRTYVRARDILRKLEYEIGLQVCTLDFPKNLFKNLITGIRRGICERRSGD